MSGVLAIICKGCGQPAVKRGASQKYCVKCCSDTKNADRTRSHSNRRATPRQPSLLQRQIRTRDRGIELSRQDRSSLLNYRNEADLAWQVAIAVPFDWAASKNHIFALRNVGHVALRKQSSDYRDAVAATLRASISRSKGEIEVVQNKVWIDIFVQKPNHRGDAINFVDFICDAIKVAIGVDDRWFSIRHLDWEICKDNPRIFISVGQETNVPVSPCSSCGRLLTFDRFHRNKATKSGVSRACKDCSSAGDGARDQSRRP